MISDIRVGLCKIPNALEKDSYNNVYKKYDHKLFLVICCVWSIHVQDNVGWKQVLESM
jgi:hypothetical protein